jgi:hypothetical protein
MQAAVRELVDRSHVQVSERVQLLHAAEMEERVAADDTGDVPEGDPEAKPDQRNRERVPGRRTRDDTKRERQRDHSDDAEHEQRQHDRAVHDEHEQQSRTERSEPPGDGGRRASEPGGACHERARQEDDERCRYQPEPEPEPVRREQPCDAQEGQGEEQDRGAANAAT